MSLYSENQLKEANINRQCGPNGGDLNIKTGCTFRFYVSLNIYKILLLVSCSTVWNSKYSTARF
jgi:hypothetical protein